MLFSKMFIKTLKESPRDAETISHKLMYRSGMIKKLSSGIYEWLPIGFKVLKKVENIIREELDKVGLQEVFLPALQPRDLWDKSKRWDIYGDELMRLTDRHNREFCLGPTHEEVITDMVAHEIKSYKELPVIFYQFQTKFRDEIRPRFGIMRAREFYMKDAYSFDTDDVAANESYNKMVEVYKDIFSRCGFDFKIVEANSGAIGGSFSHEFMVLASNGESKIVSCACGYSANIEKAESKIIEENDEEIKKIEKVSTPEKKSVEEVSEFLKIDKFKFIKSMVYLADEEPIVVLIRGDKEINEHKLINYLNCFDLKLVDPEKVKELIGVPMGFVGPVGLKKEIRVISDLSVKNIKNAVTGANDENFHYINVNFGHDFKVKEEVDVRNVDSNDKCIKCGENLDFSYGIEVGHTFKLGTKYSKSFDATYLDSEGKSKNIIMGCYGIGVSRIVAACIEQCNDKDGIIWPYELAPIKIGIVPTDIKNELLFKTSFDVYNKLKDLGYDIILDDRDERPGVKFKDMDLIGVPIRITVGKKFLENNKLEVKLRKTGEVEFVDLNRIEEYIENTV